MLILSEYERLVILLFCNWTGDPYTVANDNAPKKLEYKFFIPIADIYLNVCASFNFDSLKYIIKSFYIQRKLNKKSLYTRKTRD